MAGSDTKNNLPVAAVIKCKCGADVVNTLHRSALAYACAQCSGYYLNEKGFGYRFREKFKLKVVPDIPLHSTGMIDDVKYEVIGFMQRRQIGAEYDWREYVLYNPAHGFVTLSEYNGHWNLIRPISDYPRDVAIYPTIISYHDRQFQVYNRYKATVKYAEGEFPYDLFTDRLVQNTEWIAPPFILVREYGDDEIRWSLGELFTDDDLKRTFGDLVLPKKSGVGATQLMKLGMNSKTLVAATVIFVVVLLALQLLFDSTALNKKVFSGVYHPTDMNKEKAIVTPPFMLEGGTSALQFDVYVPLNNNWFDVDIELINDLSGERFEVAKSIEFYSGRDDEGAWSEGSQSDYIIMSSVPDGKYHLNLYPQWNAGVLDKPFEIKVFRGVSLWANFWLILLISLVVPFIYYFRVKAFEARRWMEAGNVGS